MGKVHPHSLKYELIGEFEVHGKVDLSDIVGAMYGQTEGLLGKELNLSELRNSGKVSRLTAEFEVVEKNLTKGKFWMPCGLDMVSTSVLAAALESIDKVGPFDAKIKIIKIEDTRAEKRKRIYEKAKEFLRMMLETQMPDTTEILTKIKEEVNAKLITEYGSEKLPAGPAIDSSESIIVVEGRADVLNLLKYGFDNVIALGGVKIPKTIIDLAEKKEATLFVDGDRGGDLIIEQLLAFADIDFVAKAPNGKEVEELTRKEINTALIKKVPADFYKEKFLERDLEKELNIEELEEIVEELEHLEDSEESEQKTQPKKKE